MASRRFKTALDPETVRRRARNRKIGYSVVATLTLGYAIFAYAFICQVSVRPESQTVAVAKKGNRADLFAVAPNSLDDETYREAALAWERDRIAEDEAKQQTQTNTRSPYNRWYERVSQIEAQLEGIEDPPEGSVHWHLKQSLEQMYQDKPER